MDPPLYSRFNSYRQLIHCTGCLGLLPCNPKDTLFHELPPSFSYTNWPDPWLLIQCDQPATHHSTEGGPEGSPIP